MQTSILLCSTYTALYYAESVFSALASSCRPQYSCAQQILHFITLSQYSPHLPAHTDLNTPVLNIHCTLLRWISILRTCQLMQTLILLCSADTALYYAAVFSTLASPHRSQYSCAQQILLFIMQSLYSSSLLANAEALCRDWDRCIAATDSNWYYSHVATSADASDDWVMEV